MDVYSVCDGNAVLARLREHRVDTGHGGGEI